MTGRAGTIHILTGCTAAGKTEVALRWAERTGAEIISCDSLLFYRGMDIGTAKPSLADRRRIPHHLIDVLEVTERMDVVRYARLAEEAARGISARGRPILVVGGSGFYLRGFFSAVADEIEVGGELRRQVASRLATEGLPALLEELRRRNPEGLGGLDTANPRRVARALERCLASGRTLAELGRTFAAQPAPFAGWVVKLARVERSAEALDARIAARTRAMLEAGLIGEVDRLAAAGLRDNPSAARAIGYREVLAWRAAPGSPGEALPRAADLARLADAIVRSTRALVKKQRTWFRTQLPAHPLLPPDSDPPAGWFES